jgi:8-oxo-dGTP diphosphatase/2-hydroxy-dATP diphosphatase
MNNIKQATLVFLIKKSGFEIKEICLAMKKRGFGANRWNGVGGKVEVGETIEEAAIREAEEEISVRIKDLYKVAELTFYFSENPDWNQTVYVYLAESWEGEPIESEEMCPQWYQVDKIPYDDMWPDDIFWLPEILKGRKLSASFTLGSSDIILKKDIKIVDKYFFIQ